MPEAALSALTLAVVAGALAFLAPRFIEQLPEPDQAPEDKTAYADLVTPGLGVRLAIASVLVGGALGARLGWAPDLIWWALLVPVLVVLSFIDWRTRYLPTKIIAPTYLVLIGLLLLVSVLPFGHGLDGLKDAAIGWLVMGGLYLVLWLVYPRGIGYGDVRLSGVLGLALGHLGLTETLVGLYAGFLTGAIGGVLLMALKKADRRHIPFGPFMVAGAFLAVLAGVPIADALGY